MYAGSSYVLHVAAQKKIGAENLKYPELPSSEDDQLWQKYWTEHREWWAKYDALPDEYRPIGLPHDGESFYFETLEELKEKLVYLQELGYYIPSHAFAGIDADIKS